MNMTEANNVNLLLDWLLGTEDDPPTSDQARQAAAALADRAYSALHAGFDASDVRHLWPAFPDEPLLGGALSALQAALDLLPDDDEPSGPPITTITPSKEVL